VVPSVPEPIAEAIQRALSLNSDERFATVEEFWRALSSYKIAEGTEAPIVMPVPLPQQGFANAFAPVTPPVDTLATGVPRKAGMSAVDRDRKNRTLFPVFIALALVAIVAGAALGALHLPAQTSHGQPTPIHRPTTAPTTVPTTKPTTQPTTVQAHYPVLISSYNGNISDVLTKPSTNSTMSLTHISQNGATISGYFAVGSGLSGSGNFTGSVTTDNKIQFTVPGLSGFLPLFFQGQVQPDGSITGTYCSYRNTGCDYAGGGYGYWNVLPVVPNAPSSSITIPSTSWKGDDGGDGQGNGDGHGKKNS